MRAIAGEVGASLSSVSVWVRDIPRTPQRSGPKLRLVRLPVLSGDMKECGCCRRLLPAEFFNKHVRRRRQHWCRNCFNAYFRARGALHREQVRAGRERRVAVAQRHALEYLRSRACADCGESRATVLDFDHVRGEKIREVAALIRLGSSLPKLDAEIEKCDVVCANCHRRRTAIRGNSWRARASRGEDPNANLRPLQARNLRFVRQVLESNGCVDCGTRDLMVLEFDHVGEKRFNVTKGIWYEYSLGRIADEIARCEIRCANCHRRRTAKEGAYFRQAAIR